MLSCKVGNTNINVIDYEEKQLRSWSNRGLLKCPVCGEKLIYRHGLVRIPHFSHEKDKECTYTYFENETKEHHLAKIFIYNILKKNDLINNLKLEAYIHETKQRPDLYFEFNGLKYVIECQCTPITVEEIQERKELYKLNNIIDIWIFGTEKLKENKPLACQNFLDTYLILNPFEEQLVLRKNNDCKVYKRIDNLINLLHLYNNQYFKIDKCHEIVKNANKIITFLYRYLNLNNLDICNNICNLFSNDDRIIIKIEPNDSKKNLKTLDEYFQSLSSTCIADNLYLKASELYRLEKITSQYGLKNMFKIINNEGRIYYL